MERVPFGFRRWALMVFALAVTAAWISRLLSSGVTSGRVFGVLAMVCLAAGQLLDWRYEIRKRRR